MESSRIMITEFLINQVSDFFKTLVTITGYLPDTPASIQSILDTITTYSAQGFSFLAKVLSPELTIAIFTMITAVFLYFSVWTPIVFIYKRIRG
jgi:phage-related protein